MLKVGDKVQWDEDRMIGWITAITPSGFAFVRTRAGNLEQVKLDALTKLEMSCAVCKNFLGTGDCSVKQHAIFDGCDSFSHYSEPEQEPLALFSEPEKYTCVLCGYNNDVAYMIMQDGELVCFECADKKQARLVDSDINRMI